MGSRRGSRRSKGLIGTRKPPIGTWSKRGVKGEGIVLYGESLGGAVAVETAIHHPVGGIILDSTFTSAVAIARALLLLAAGTLDHALPL